MCCQRSDKFQKQWIRALMGMILVSITQILMKHHNSSSNIVHLTTKKIQEGVTKGRNRLPLLSRSLQRIVNLSLASNLQLRQTEQERLTEFNVLSPLEIFILIHRSIYTYIVFTLGMKRISYSQVYDFFRLLTYVI